MKRLRWMALLCGAVGMGASGAATAAGPAAQGTAILDEARLGAPIVQGNLAIYPLVAKKAPADDVDYLTVDEALDKKLLTIVEKGTEGQVSELHVINTSKRPIFAMGGEVLLGGKQDRIVARNTIIPGKAKRYGVDVFCVEHGRWRTATSKFGSANKLAHTKLRQTAGKQSAGRMGSNQGAVWNEVAKTNAKRKTSNGTDTYRAAISGKRDAEVKAAVASIKAALGKRDDIAGVAVVINGQPRGVDWFASPAIFAKLRDKLIGSYVDEALDMATGKPHATPSSTAVEAFLNKAEQSKQTAETTSGDSKFVNFDSLTIEGQQTTQNGVAAPVSKSYFMK